MIETPHFKSNFTTSFDIIRWSGYDKIMIEISQKGRIHRIDGIHRTPKLSENKADKRNQPEIKSFLKTSI